MSKNKPKQAASPEQEMGLALDDLVKRGARHVIGQAIEAELAELLASCAHVTTLHGKRAVVRSGPVCLDRISCFISEVLPVIA